MFLLVEGTEKQASSKAKPTVNSRQQGVWDKAMSKNCEQCSQRSRR